MPLECRECGSSCVQICGDYGHQVCHDCGSMFEEDTVQGVEITASILKCPHCTSIDAVVAYGGEEQCNICGLDPNERDLAIGEIAHLWKKRTIDTEDDEKLIREIMTIKNSNGKERFRPETNLGKFLRTVCGPHCEYSSKCPQTTKNLSNCYREELATEESDMSRRGRK